MSDTKKPAAKISIFPVSAAIWANKTAKSTLYSVTLESCYKDADGRWKGTNRLNENELLLGAKALDLAHSEILKLRANDRQSGQSDDEAT